MRKVGVWERGEGLRAAIEEDLKKSGLPRPLLIGGQHPAVLLGEEMDLLVVSPGATGWAGAGGLHCRLALVPDGAGVLMRGLKAEGAVSYGSGPKNTITLSSIEEERISIAIQRELVTVEGGMVERQELVLPYPKQGQTPEFFMARVGTLLLLGGNLAI